MTSSDRDGLDIPQRYWAVATIGLGIAMSVIDGAIANVALPTIARDLAADPASSVWVVNAYQLAVIVSLLPLAALGDEIGYRRVYVGGLVLFTLASIGCAASDSLTALTVARTIQGFGASGIMCVNSALIRFIYPRAQLGRGIGINAVVVALSTAIGPTVASAILSFGAWQWLFAVNVPIGVATLAIGQRTLPATPRAPRSFDIPSAVLNALTFGPLIIGIDSLGGQRPWLVTACLALAVAAGAVLVWRQTKMAVPMLPIDLLRIPIFALSVGTSVCSFAAQTLAFVALPFLLQGGPGFSDVQTGFLMTPWPLAIVVVAPIAGRLADRHAAGMLGGIGLAVFAVGLAALALMPAHPSSGDVVWRMAVAGAGFGLFQSPNNRAMIGAAPPRRTGGASGMLGTARLLGQTLGASLVALIFGRVGQGGTTVALLVGTGFAVAGACVSLTRLRIRAKPLDE